MAGPGREVNPQAVLSPLTRAALFLVVTIDPGGESRVRDLLADLAGLERAVGFRSQEGRLSCVTGIGSRAWDRLFAGPRPAELHPFRELTGPGPPRGGHTGRSAVSHPRPAAGPVLRAGSEIMDRVREVVTVRDEVAGFKYFDVRDLLGFVDGTETRW
ncbi:Dyp-type peroxidase domain-containing protein [Acrocarpospora sp. B8E8]|uniref:Dyp-type peroxidase n=1 Tax=Acrocarpospora sp. B8E8 TaxID=3153572 RepID=UPI00325D2E40